MRLKQRIREWLEVPTDLTEDIEALNKKLDELKEAVEKFTEIECSFCHKIVKTYPLGGGYYREADGSVLCSDACLNGKKLLGEKA